MTSVLQRSGPYRLPVEQVIRAVALQGGAHFYSRAKELLTDPVDRLVIFELASQYEKDRSFNQPVRVIDGVVTDGLRRLVAANLRSSRPSLSDSSFALNLEVTDTERDTALLAGPLLSVFVLDKPVQEFARPVPLTTPLSLILTPPLVAPNAFMPLVLRAAESLATPLGWLKAAVKEYDAAMVTYLYPIAPDDVEVVLPSVLARFSALGIAASVV